MAGICTFSELPDALRDRAMLMHEVLHLWGRPGAGQVRGACARDKSIQRSGAEGNGRLVGAERIVLRRRYV
jgi:hypothetical protein